MGAAPVAVVLRGIPVAGNRNAREILPGQHVVARSVVRGPKPGVGEHHTLVPARSNVGVGGLACRDLERPWQRDRQKDGRKLQPSRPYDQRSMEGYQSMQGRRSIKVCEVTIAAYQPLPRASESMVKSQYGTAMEGSTALAEEHGGETAVGPGAKKA